ncbi:uncharacterized protein LOC111895834 [Lactuca sativa]|uniref:Uncharacterized protein n=1 Tax=Lactuca sativa TaxID=4236 RepID=A0A9R1XMV6_LACSA|nr:uncharacterized protein LOC111895834 [Lactuca sativa]KAJ0219021.1 hypothetical protein LSAT_V11C300127990 [Lactuca sativa]
MKELAEQELKILEAQHPTRFQLLKLELKAFIQLFDEEEQQQSFERKQQQQQQFHLSILTQESSSRKRERMKVEREEGKTKRGRRRRAEEGRSGAIQKAEACLRKIEALKSLFRSSNG